MQQYFSMKSPRESQRTALLTIIHLPQTVRMAPMVLIRVPTVLKTVPTVPTV